MPGTPVPETIQLLSRVAQEDDEARNSAVLSKRMGPQAQEQFHGKVKVVQRSLTLFNRRLIL